MKTASCALGGRSGHEAGRQLLRRLYEEETGEPLPPILTTPRGKPYFENSPWHFSISHTRSHAFCVLAKENVAIDAEELDRKVPLRLAVKILSPREKAQFDAAPDKGRALLTFWVLKEAAAKLSGEGLRGYPVDTDFSLEDPRVTEWDGCLVAILGETPMLEKMDRFFDARLEGYDVHMLTAIAGAWEFYPFTAGCLPLFSGARVLDLGCGTGLELEHYFRRNPGANITGIDLSPGMLGALRDKFPDRKLQLILGSYFEVPFGRECYDAAVSVESLHHFTQAEKIPLYRKLYAALKPGAYFILTDYFAPSESEERFFHSELVRLKKQQGIPEDEFYHYDTPLTVAHETGALAAAGFSKVEVLKNWAATYTLKAYK